MRSFRSLCWILTAAALVSWGGVRDCHGFSPPRIEQDVTLLAHFDSSLVPEYTRGKIEPVMAGALLIPNGKWSGGMSLPKGAYFAVPAMNVIRFRRGTIMFWVYPQWLNGSSVSHTLFSMRWKDGRMGYFALSSGWWEPAGAGRLYFVLNNQVNNAHCSAGRSVDLLRQGIWHHVAVTWDTTGPATMDIYVDGDIVASQPVKSEEDFQPDGYFYLGTDLPTAEKSGRSAESLFDELVMYDRALSRSEINARYLQQEKDMALAREFREAWLNDMTVHPRRRNKGIFRDKIILDEDVAWSLSRKAIDDRLRRAKAAGFSVYAPCIWHGMGSRWPSELVPSEWTVRSLRPEDGLDPLAYLLEQAHKVGLRVVVWVTIALGPTWGNVPAGFLSRYYGVGTPTGAFNIHDPEFASFIVGLVAEVAKNYSIDGVFLDYARSMGICTDQLCIASYMADTGRDLNRDVLLYQKDAGVYRLIADWNERTVGGIVKRISETVRHYRPKALISAYGSDIDVTNLEGRNVVKWANQGTIDLIGHGDYNADIDYRSIDAQVDRVSNPDAVFVLLGNFDRDALGSVRPRNAGFLARLVTFAERRWPGNAIGIYFYSYLTNQQAIELSKGPFSEKPSKTSGD